MSQIAKMSTRGQIAIPKAIRTARRWKPGTEFVIQETSEGVLLRPTTRQSERTGKIVTWGDVVGTANYKGPRKSISEMNEGVIQEARKHR